MLIISIKEINIAMPRTPCCALALLRLAKQAWSAACGLGDRKAVFQHLKADNFTIGDGEHDREVRSDNLAGSLELGGE
jgi:hypothetical protein